MSDVAISSAQEALASAVVRAQAEEDRELTKRVREIGSGLVISLNGLFRMARTHALSNAAFDAPVHDMRTRLQTLLDLLGPVHVMCVEDQIYVNEVRIRFEGVVEQGLALAEELRRHNTGGITFNEILKDQEVRELVRLFAAPADELNPRTALGEALATVGLHSVELHPIQQFKLASDDSAQLVQEFRETYVSSAGHLAEAFASVGHGRLPNPLLARRAVTQFIDAAAVDDILPLALAAEDDIPPFAQHTLAVTVLSLLIGKEAGLSKASLADLGVAAMLHDVGFSMTERGATVPFARHTRAGLKALLRQRGFYQAKVRRLLAILQHHRPCNDPLGVPSLYARIIHLADDYDTMTRERNGRPAPYAPPDAVACMAAQGFKAYDADLLQAMINVLGPYPPGTVLRLHDGRVVVSASTVRSPETFRTPLCRLLRRADGRRPSGDEMVDLAREGQVAAIVRGPLG